MSRCWILFWGWGFFPFFQPLAFSCDSCAVVAQELNIIELGPVPQQKEVVGDFCSTNFGGFCRGFSWRIFWALVSHKNVEKKSGDKMAGISGDFYLVSVSHERKHENSCKISGKFGAKFGELSFCNFSDLKNRQSPRASVKPFRNSRRPPTKKSAKHPFCQNPTLTKGDAIVHKRDFSGGGQTCNN